MIKKLFKASIIYGIGPQIPKLVNILILPLITQYLTPDDYGAYGLIVAYMGGLSALKDLGLVVVASNSFYKFKNRFQFIWKRLYGFLSLWSPFVALLNAILLWIIIPDTETQNFWTICLLTCVPIALFDPTIFFGRRFFHLSQRPGSFVAISITSSIAAILSNYILIVHFDFGYLAWFYSSFLAAAINFTVYFYMLVIKEGIHPSFKFNKAWIWRILLISLPVIPHSYSSYLMDFSGRLVLDYYHLTLSTIGNYNFAANFSSYFTMVSASLALASGPIYLELFSKKERRAEIEARNMTLAMLTLTLILAVFISLWLREIFNILVRNEELALSYKMAAIIIMANAFKPMYFGPVTKLEFTEQTRLFWRISFIAALVNIVLSFILVPMFETWGVVIAYFIANLYICFVGYFLKSFRTNNVVKYYEGLVLIVVVCATAMVFYFQDFEIIYKSLLSFLLLLIMGYVIWKNRASSIFSKVLRRR